jgi:hypothetical protein
VAEDRGFNFITDGTTGKGARPLPLATYPYFALSRPGVNFMNFIHKKLGVFPMFLGIPGKTVP